MSCGLRVEIFWNLQKKLFSVRPLKGPQRGLVCLYTDLILLEDVAFVVQPAGRARVLREKRKNVHAFVRGMLVSTGANVPVEIEEVGWDFVTYNPYLAPTFCRLSRATKDWKPIQTASHFLGCVEWGMPVCRVASLVGAIRLRPQTAFERSAR